MVSIKMVLLTGKIAELYRGAVFAVGQLTKIQRFVNLCVFVYGPRWMSCPIASAAPKGTIWLYRTPTKSLQRITIYVQLGQLKPYLDIYGTYRRRLSCSAYSAKVC